MQCFCRPFDLGLLHPSLVYICIVANPLQRFHTWTGGGREKGREGEREGGRKGNRGREREREEGNERRGGRVGRMVVRRRLVRGEREDGRMG